MEQTTKTSCRPEAWRTEKRALYPLSMHRSYRLRKSSLVVAAENVVGGGNRRTLDSPPSRTKLAQDGAANECDGLAGSMRCCWVSTSLSRLPSTPAEGVAGKWGW
jgi:hypothetical protein